MIINKPSISIEDGIAYLRCLIETDGQKAPLWYAVDASYKEYLVDEKGDAFLLALLSYAMRKGEDIEIRCAVSEKLYYNITNSLMSALCAIVPSYKPVTITASALTCDAFSPASQGVTTGISGGLDSFHTVIRHHIDSDVPANYRLTHLINNNVGAHGTNDSSLFLSRNERMQTLADELGLPLVKIDSNLAEFTRDDFTKTHSLANTSAVMALQKLFGKYLYSSSRQYKDCFVGEAKDISRADPAIIPLLGTEDLDTILSGSQRSRTQKAQFVSDYPITYKYLDVCTRKGYPTVNCSECQKCTRTLISMDIYGKLDNYSHTFDLAKYRTKKTSLIRKMLRATDPSSEEIKAVLRERNYNLLLLKLGKDL